MNWKIRTENRIKIIETSDGKANAMNMKYLNRLDNEFTHDESFDGVILAGDNRFFSAGLDLFELSEMDWEGVYKTIEKFEKVLLKVMTFDGPVIALINGHAVAAGCLMAFCCDYRIGTYGKYNFGISALAIGVDIPPVVLIATHKSVPSNQLFHLVTSGRYYSPEEAIPLGFINELVKPADGMNRAIEKAQHLTGALGPFTRLKKRMLKPELEILADGTDSAKEFADQWFTPETKEKIAAVLKRLRKK